MNAIKVLAVEVPRVDGGSQSLDASAGLRIVEDYITRQFGDYLTGKEIIETLLTDDWGCPPTSVRLGVLLPDGRRVTLHVPYDDTPSERVCSQFDEQIGRLQWD